MNRPVSTFILALLLATPLTHAQDTPADVLADPALDLNRPADRAKAVAKIKAIEDARAAKTRAKAKALGLKIRTEKPDGGLVEIVDFEGDRPVYIETKNLNAAISTGANLVQASPYGLDGTGIIAGVWDGGSVRSTHQEFANGSRVSIMDGAAGHNHATHVGGTIGAQGMYASAKGMATNVSIASYDWNSDTSEMTGRAATGPDQFDTKIYLSNHSYGTVNGWNGIQWVGNGTDQNAADYSFGQYSSMSNTVDALLYSAPYYTVFWAAGNDGSDNPSTGSTVLIGSSTVAYDPAIHPPGDGVYRNGFETIASEGIAKNLITIGAANDAVTSGSRDPSKSTLTSFSSTGPTDDGRIKPDLVANGYSLTSTVLASDTSYGGMSGTSMASPNATGSAVLVVDQYKRLFNSAMRASTLKALLIHTATDVGNPGPDYKYGWGLVDTKKAVDLIRDHHANPGKIRIIEDQVSTSSTSRTYSFLWDGGSPLRATVCWTDPAATAISTHDSRTSRLVNNLNLKLIAPNGTEYFPYVMPFVGTWTVASMSQNATTGINNTDNTETVHIQSPGLTGTWQAVVSYAGALTNNTQAYGLILSGTADAPNMVNVTSPNGGETFYHSTSYPISWVSNVAGNVSIELLKGGSLHSVLSANEANDGSFTWSVPASLPSGSDYTIRISSVNNATYSDVSNATFTITPPPTLADALDTSGLTWTTSGNAAWFPQSNTTYDGMDAAESGNITDSQSSSMETTLTGPGTLTFWWKVSSESGWDFLEFYLNNTLQTGDLARISGEVDWVQKTVSIPSGSQPIKWTYKKDASLESGSDTAWVDQVVWTPSVAPDIAVEQPVGTNLTDGSASINFGSVTTGSSSSAFTFTIRNTGNTNLTGLALSKSGTHSADYTLGSLGATTLAPGASTTFTATFTPGALGTRTAAIQIASNDPNENPFDINLAGTCVPLGTLDVTTGGLASTGTYGGPFSPDTKIYTLTNIGSTSINWTAAKTQSWVTLSATSGTLAAGASTTLTASIGSAANSLNAGSYSDTITLTNTTNGNGTTTRTVNLTVNPLSATVSLGNLLQYHDGFPKPVSVTTTPSNLAHTVTYNGSSTAPSAGGTYAVVATITDPNHTGSANGNLIIAYAVTYNGNGNTSGTVPANQDKLHDINLTLATNSGGLVKTDHTFTGWNTAANGTGTGYPAGSTYTANSPVTLYAQWELGTDGTWTPTAAGPFNWNDSANWSGGIPAVGSNRNALFTPNITAAQTVNLDAAVTIGNITFTDSTTSSNDLTISGANALTLARSSSAPVIDVTQSGRTLTISSNISGTNGLQKNGAGNLVLSGTNNTFSGGVSIHAGTLQIASAANLGDSANVVTFTGGSTFTFGANTTLSQGFAINAGVTGTIYGYDRTAVTIDNSLAGSGTLLVYGGGVNGINLTFTSTNSTFSGDIIIRGHDGSYAGTLTMNSLADTPGSRIKTGVASAAIFNYGAGAVVPLVLSNRQIEISSGPAVLNNNATNVNSTVTVNTDLLVTVNANRTFTLGGGNTGNNTFAGVIGNRTGYQTSLTKANAGKWIVSNDNTFTGSVGVSGGTLVLSGTNQYIGPTVLTGGTLQIAGIADGDTASSMGKASSNPNNLRLVSGSPTLRYTGDGDSTNRNFALLGSATIDSSGTDALVFSQTGAISPDDSESANFATGQKVVTGLGSTADLAVGMRVTGTGIAANSTIASIDSASQITLSTNTTAVGSGTTLSFGYPTARTLTLTGTSTAANTIAGVLQNSTAAGTGVLSMTKSGIGTWVLSGANTYTGATTISGGKLFINGDQTLATGNVSVAANATLGGTGIIGGNTTIAADGRLEFDLSTNAASHNKLELASGKTLTFSGASSLTITSSSGAAVGTYTLLSAPSGLTVNTLPTLVLPSGWAATVSKVGTDLVLNVTSVGALTPFEQWAVTSGLSGGNATSGADPDGDGWTNLQEFAFGTLPNAAVSVPLAFTPGGEVTQTGSPVLRGYTPTQGQPPYQAVFGRRKNHAAAGLTYSAEFSANLTYWTPSNSGASILTGAGSHEIEVVAVPFPETVPLSLGGTDAPPKFFRIRVAGTP